MTMMLQQTLVLIFIVLSCSATQSVFAKEEQVETPFSRWQHRKAQERILNRQQQELRTTTTSNRRAKTYWGAYGDDDDDDDGKIGKGKSKGGDGKKMSKETKVDSSDSKDSKEGKKMGKKGAKKGTTPAPVPAPVPAPTDAPSYSLTEMPTTDTPSEFPSFSHETEEPTMLPSQEPSLGLPPCAEPCLDTCIPFYLLLTGFNQTAAELACDDACPCIIKCYRSTQECDDIYDECVFGSRPDGCLCQGGSAIKDFWSLLTTCGADPAADCPDVCTNDLGQPQDDCVDTICPCTQNCFLVDDIIVQQQCVAACVP